MNKRVSWMSEQGDEASWCCPVSWCWGWVKQRTSHFPWAPSGAGTWDEKRFMTKCQLCPARSWTKRWLLWTIVIGNPGNLMFPSEPWQQIMFSLGIFNISRCPLAFPGGSHGKESTFRAGDLGSILGSRRSPGVGNSCLFILPFLSNTHIHSSASLPLPCLWIYMTTFFLEYSALEQPRPHLNQSFLLLAWRAFSLALTLGP